MHISTALFLQTQGAQNDPKISKESVRKTLKQGLELDAPSATPTTHQKSVENALTHLMKSLSTEAKTKGAILEFLQQSPLFKNLGNFSNELKSLIATLKSNPEFEKPLLLLQNFQKHITTVDAKVLKTQVQNSGLFFESILAQKSDKEAFIQTLKTLSADLKEHLTQIPKTASLTKELTPLLQRLSEPSSLGLKEVQTTLKQTLELLRQGTKEHLFFESPSALKPSYALASKLETLAESTSFLHVNSESKTPSPQIPLQSLKEVLLSLKNEFQTHHSQAIQQELLPHLDGIVQHLTVMASAPATTATLPIEASLQEQLSMLANRIKQEISTREPKVAQLHDFAQKSAHLEQKILTTLKPEVFIAPEIMHKLSIDPSDAQILGDIKGVLTHVGEKLSQTASPIANNALELTNKLLTQIEYHQLISYVGSSNHLYIPFSWEGLKEGSMMMKQTKEETFHCQIDLDLEQYGKLNMMLLLTQERYLEMSIATQKNELGEKVQIHLGELKTALAKEGIVVQGVRLLEYKEVASKKEYFADDTLHFGINITI